MRLHDYARREGRGALARLKERSNVSYTTICAAKNGAPIKRYEVAKAISDATDGEVSIEDLCTPAAA
jgi:hypothetical protein